MLYRNIIELETEPEKLYDITSRVKSILTESKIANGVCYVFLQATTAGLMVNENNKMLFEDFRRVFDDVAPHTRLYQHPDNAASHIKASMLSQHLTLPVANSQLLLGKWQSILLWEFDVRDRKRTVIVTVGY